MFIVAAAVATAATGTAAAVSTRAARPHQCSTQRSGGVREIGGGPIACPRALPRGNSQAVDRPYKSIAKLLREPRPSCAQKSVHVRQRDPSSSIGPRPVPQRTTRVPPEICKRVRTADAPRQGACDEQAVRRSQRAQRGALGSRHAVQ